MTKRILLVLALVVVCMPQTTKASAIESFGLLFSDEVYLEEEVTSFTNLRQGGVLGASTDEEKTTSEVPKKLDKTFVSYFKDISFKPPQGWSVTDDFAEFEEQPTFSTYVVNDNMTAQVAIFRTYDEDLTLKSLEEEVSLLCELCGYKIEKKGTTKLGKIKGKFIEATSPETHFMIYLFDIGDVSYMIQTSAPLDEKKAYRNILEKSYKSIKINSKKLPLED